MLIKALCDYYDILSKSGKVLPDGYSKVKVNYLISLSQDGKIDHIVNWQKTEESKNAKGKIKEVQVPREIMMFQRSEKPGICSNLVEHRPLYIFGLNFDNGIFTAADRTQKAKKSHDDFVNKNLDFIEGIDTPLVNAYRNFMKTWIPEEECENPFLKEIAKYGTSGFAFCLSGHPEMLLHEEESLINRWNLEYIKNQEESAAAIHAQCAISGENAAIARIHGKIKGIPGGLATGTVLIGFNNPSESSYGNDQSYNSNISERAMKKYTEALNRLISDRTHRTMLDDTTIIHWAMSPGDQYDEIYNCMLCEEEKMDESEVNELLDSVLKNTKKGMLAANINNSIQMIDPGVDYYMVGFKPNTSRLAVKFIYRRCFGDLLHNIAMHRDDMQVGDKKRNIPLWRIKKELISPKSKNETVDPALMCKILEAIVYGYNYPDFLLATVIKRIKTDHDEDKNTYIKMNDIRIGIVKACINRKSRLSGQKEELKVALDLENNNTAYLCGRMFAVLEKLQQDASNNSLNRTIKDSYFSAASSKPAIIFPKLLKLAQNHIQKASYGGYWNYKIGEIMNKLGGEFPDTLPLAEQGKFIIGYYQQYYAAKEKTSETKKEEEN